MDQRMVIEILYMDNVTVDIGWVSNRLIAFGSFYIHSFCPSMWQPFEYNFEDFSSFNYSQHNIVTVVQCHIKPHLGYMNQYKTLHFIKMVIHPRSASFLLLSFGFSIWENNGTLHCHCENEMSNLCENTQRNASHITSSQPALIVVISYAILMQLVPHNYLE